MTNMDQSQFEILVRAISSIAEPNWGVIASLVISTINLILIFFVYKQLKAHADLMRWNRATIQNEKLFEAPDVSVELAVASILENHNIKANEPIPVSKCADLYDDPKSRIPVMAYLNHFETILVAVSANVVDQELASNLHSARVIYIWDIWKEFCKLVRVRRQDEEIFWEMEKWAGHFSKEQKSRADIEKIHREEAENKISRVRGMKKI